MREVFVVAGIVIIVAIHTVDQMKVAKRKKTPHGPELSVWLMAVVNAVTVEIMRFARSLATKPYMMVC